MAVRALKSFFPTADELLAADISDLGEVLLVHLNSYEGRVKQHGRLYLNHLLAILDNRKTGLGPYPPAPEYGPRQPEVTRRVMEAWYWLERQGFLIPDPSCHGWHLISTDGERLLAKLLAAISGGASIDPNIKGDNRSVQIRGPDDTYLLVEPAGDRYQWRRAGREAKHEAPSNNRKRRTDQGLQQLKVRVRKLRAEHLSYQEICRRLGDTPRPPRATWRDLTWPQAYRHHTSAVTKWLSEACS
jgi:hypothetical protein